MRILLTEIGLTSGDSSTVEQYIQTVHRTTQRNRIQHKLKRKNTYHTIRIHKHINKDK